MCIEQTKQVLAATKKFCKMDPEVTLFAKIIEHKIDE